MHEELVNALRCCVTDYNSIQSRLCNKCQYAKYADGKYGCENKLKADAADAIDGMNNLIAQLGENFSEMLSIHQAEIERLKRDKEQEEYNDWIYNDRPCPDFAREE